MWQHCRNTQMGLYFSSACKRCEFTSGLLIPTNPGISHPCDCDDLRKSSTFDYCEIEI